MRTPGVRTVTVVDLNDNRTAEYRTMEYRKGGNVVFEYCKHLNLCSFLFWINCFS